MRRFLLASTLVSAACGGPAADLGSTGSPVVYGQDDRLELYEYRDRAGPDASAALAGAVAGKVFSSELMTSGGDAIGFGSRTLQSVVGVCDQEPFADQPSGMHCTGALIGPDLLLTAGHCIRACAGREDCAGASCSELWAFGFFLDDRFQTASVQQEDIFQCAEVLVGRGDYEDYAVIRLDQVVPNRSPLRVAARPTEVGDSVVLAGHPAGLPLKIDPNGIVAKRWRGSPFFGARMDAFGGNSGGPVLNAAGEIAGIVVSGESDFILDPSQGCRVSTRRANDASSGQGEIAYDAPAALSILCAQHPFVEVCAPDEVEQDPDPVAPEAEDGGLSAPETPDAGARADAATSQSGPDSGRGDPSADAGIDDGDGLLAQESPEAGCSCAAEQSRPQGGAMWLAAFAAALVWRRRSAGTVFRRT